MATKIRRCLFVGLGGTGLTTLLHTKRMFINSYGEVPPMIGFLGIDTDGKEYNKTLPSRYGNVSLAPNEQMRIQVESPVDIYRNYRDRLNWLPENNVDALTSMTAGAGMVRTNGRFALGINYSELTSRVKSKLNEITNIQVTSNKKYSLLGDEVEISMIFSIAGGTGCGTFLDTAYLLKSLQEHNTDKLIGYAVLPDVFDAQLVFNKERLKPNGFGALCDWDYLMHQGVDDSFTFDYLTQTVTVHGRPFNAVYMASNKNFNNTSYDNVNQIAEMISRSLVTSAGELSGSVSSVADNAEKDMISGIYDIEDKRAWVSALGMSEITFQSTDLARIYTLKAGRRLIERMLNTCGNPELTATAWIDDPKVRIRENNDRDDVIDFMLPRNPDYPLTNLSDRDNPRPEIQDFITRSAVPGSHVPKRLGELTERIEVELHNLLTDNVNKECGIGLTRQVIESIREQVKLCVTEMQDELKKFQHMQPQIESSLEVSIKDLLDIVHKIFVKSSTKEAAEEAVVNCANAVVVNQRETERRQAALSFYTWLLKKLDQSDETLNNIQSVLENIYRTAGQELSSIQDTLMRQTSTFQIDLTVPYINRVTVADDDIDPAAFIRTLTWTDKMLDVPQRPQPEVTKAIRQYTESLPGTQQWLNLDIESALKELPEEELREKYQDALQQSSPLINLDFKGHISERIPDYYFIGVPDKENTYLEKGPVNFKNMIRGTVSCNYASIGGSDRIVIFRQFGVFPAYAISSVNDYRRNYDMYNSRPTAYCCHFDENVRRRMMRDNYSIEPKAKQDNSLELWVKGFIFGLIKNDGSMYYYKDEENGDALDDYWTRLDQYRDEAFNMFKRLVPNLEESFTNYFNILERDKGTEAIQTKLNQAKDNYLNAYSQISMTPEELKKRENKAIADLVRREINFVKKEL